MPALGFQSLVCIALWPRIGPYLVDVFYENPVSMHGVGKHQWNVPLSEIPVILRVSQASSNTLLGKHTRPHTFADGPRRQHNLTADHAFAQAVAPAAVPPRVHSGQDQQILYILRHVFLRGGVYRADVSQRLFRRGNRHRGQQIPWRGEFCQRHLHTLRSHRRDMETSAVSQKQTWHDAIVHDRSYVRSAPFAREEEVNLLKNITALAR